MMMKVSLMSMHAKYHELMMKIYDDIMLTSVLM